MKQLKLYIDGEWINSESQDFNEVYNPSTGEVIAKAPNATEKELKRAIQSAHKAYPQWSNTPVSKRVEVLRRFRQLLDENFEELVKILCTEHGKTLSEGRGDLLKVKEPVDLAISAPILMMGESMMNTSKGYDSVLYREPLGVFAGIAPFNFPGMIPMGWMTPMCIATGNTFVLKVSSSTPMTSLRLTELFEEAGLPKGVLNIVTCDKDEAQILIEDERVKGITFVGSTGVGKHIYKTASKYGKRVQALCEAKNHALVLKDAVLERTAKGIINAAFGCAGERCMALSVVCVEESIADELVKQLVKNAKNLKVGPAYMDDTELGPVVSKEHKERVVNWIEKGIQEGATLALDGRDIKVNEYENGFYLAPTIFDNVTSEMSIGDKEIFGPVLSIKRVKNFEEGLEIMNNNQFANGSVIYTSSGYYAREFTAKTHAGMTGVNVGVPVPFSIFPFSGHKNSFFGDLHVLGKDGMRFFTESKVVTTTWFTEEDNKKSVDTWGGNL